MTRKRLLAVAALAAGLAGITRGDESTPVTEYRMNADGSLLFSVGAGTDARCASESAQWTHRMDNGDQRAVLVVARAYENGRDIEIFDTDTCQGGIEFAKVGSFYNGGTPE